jgi:hypothetical protein
VDEERPGKPDRDDQTTPGVTESGSSEADCDTEDSEASVEAKTAAEAKREEEAELAAEAQTGARTEAGVKAQTEEGTQADEGAESVPADEESEPQTLAGHVETVVNEQLGTVRLLDGNCAALAEGPAESAFDLLSTAEETPQSVVLDGALDQRLLDVAAQRGVEQFVVAETGQFVKQPLSVRVRTAADLDVEA